MIKAYFINVGQGNMVLILFPDNTVMVYDCNITNDREKEIFDYLDKIMPNRKSSIDVFVSSHRDADHMRGIKKLDKKYPINTLWDSGVSGNTDTVEYNHYMDFRRKVPNVYEVGAGEHWKAKPYVKIINGKRKYLNDPNEQSIVLHINHEGSRLILTGDTNAAIWKDYIVPESKSIIKSEILLGSHHGSITFFDDLRDKKYHYTTHVKTIAPQITILSVGNNPHGHPNKKSLEYYEKYSSGSNKGNKIFRTDEDGNMEVILKGKGSWSINKNQ